MKKIISFSILIAFIILILCSCSHKTYTDDSKLIFQNKFAVIREDEGFEKSVYLVYDRKTKIVYLYITGGDRAGFSPYYIVVNGEPTVAIYGVNYES